MVAGLKVKEYATSNKLFNEIDNIQWGSNKATWASNAYYYNSNTARWGSNTAYWSSNHADWASNTACWSSNEADWASNIARWSSNVADWASNTARWSSNEADWSSNKSVWSSNTAEWVSNQARAASNKAYTDELWTNALSVVYTNSNVGIGTNTTYSKLDVDGAIHIRGESIMPNLQQGLYLNWVNGTSKVINNRGVSGGDIIFESWNGLALEKTLMKLDNMGYVGIGTNNPTYTLDVGETANATYLKENEVLLTTKYALSNALLTQKQRIDNIDTEVDVVKQKNTTQDTTLNSHNQRISALESQKTAVDEIADTLQETVDEVVDNVQTIQGELENIGQNAAIVAAQTTATAAGTAEHSCYSGSTNGKHGSSSRRGSRDSRNRRKLLSRDGISNSRDGAKLSGRRTIHSE
jgi:hypothetical protein